MKLARMSAVALALVAGPALAQVVIGGSAAIVYGPYPYGVYAPYGIVEPWAGAAPRYPDLTPSCYRYGRCTPAEIAAYRYRVERLDRLAPAAPPETGLPEPLRPPPPPTAVEDIRPEYRGASVVREEYRDSGRPVDGRN